MSYQAHVTRNGEMVLPAALAEALGLLPGDKVDVELHARAIEVAKLDPLLASLRDAMRKPEIAAMVDSLIEDRRADARREQEKLGLTR